jgi:DNA-binding SARP family transcriptional activator
MTEVVGRSAAELWVGVLGPLAMRSPGPPVRRMPGMERRLLAVLAAHAGQVVPRARIVDALWGGEPPRTCHTLVHVYVGHLRNRIEPGRRHRELGTKLQSHDDGYALRLAPDELDVAQFEVRTTAAEEARAEGRSRLAHDNLLGALRCWRGPVAHGLGGRVDHDPAVRALAHRRVTAALGHADLALALGRPEVAAAELRRIVPDEPLHEDLHARLVLALAAVGEQAAALALYAAVRDRLSSELGIEPGAQLREAHVRVLRQQVAASSSPAAGSERAAGTRSRRGPGVTPAQLPADVAGFTGRGTAMRFLDALVPGHPPAGPAALSVVSGPQGVGKTALAVRWGHRMRRHFPDGQLYADLGGRDGAPQAASADVLAAFLGALDVAPERVPRDPTAAAALYRSLLADRRVLVLLDDAFDVEQVRPLLPAGAGCLALVTSRSPLTGLVAIDGARRLDLGVLSDQEARELAGRCIGIERARAEPTAVGELVELCGRLPLALRIAATRHSDCHVLADCVAILRSAARAASLTATEALLLLDQPFGWRLREAWEGFADAPAGQSPGCVETVGRLYHRFSEPVSRRS